MNRTAIALWAISLAGLFLFGLFVWPGRYEYVSSGLELYRADRFSGAVVKQSTPVMKLSEAVLEPRQLGVQQTGFDGGQFRCRSTYVNGHAIVEVVFGPLTEKARKQINTDKPRLRLVLRSKSGFPLATDVFTFTTFAYRNQAEGKTSLVYLLEIPADRFLYDAVAAASIEAAGSVEG